MCVYVWVCRSVRAWNWETECNVESQDSEVILSDEVSYLTAGNLGPGELQGKLFPYGFGIHRNRDIEFEKRGGQSSKTELSGTFEPFR